MNITDLVLEQFTPETLQHTAEYINVTPANTQAAIHIAIPLVVAGFINQASTLGGAKELYSALEGETNTVNPYLDIKHTEGANPDFQSYINYSDGIVNLIFGSNQHHLTSLVSMESGIGDPPAMSLFNILASMTAGIVKSKITTEGLGLSGMTGFLMSQAESVKNALPSATVSLLAIEDLGDYHGDVSRAAIDTEKIGMKMLMPWFIGLIALLVSLYYIRSCSKAFVPPSKVGVIDSLALVQTLDSAEMATTDSSASQVQVEAHFLEYELPGNVKIKIPQSGVESKLLSFIEDPTREVNKDTWFEFDRLYFKSASAEIEPTSKEQLQNITQILNAYPKVKIKLGGYTDNTGNADENTKLSAARAKAAMNALIASGIGKNRLSSEGYGDQYPLADNSTEAGRAKNRRVAIKIIEK